MFIFISAGAILLMTSGFYYAVCGVVAVGVYILRNWSQGKRCHIVQRLDGKIVVITGGNTGKMSWAGLNFVLVEIIHTVGSFLDFG